MLTTEIKIASIVGLLLGSTACGDARSSTDVEEGSLEQAVLGSEDDDTATATFRTHLTGAEEVAPVETRAQGQAVFQLSSDGLELDYRLIVANIEDVSQAHIHMAEAGANGPVVAWLYPAGPPPALIEGRISGVLATGVITEDDLVGPLSDAPFEALIGAIEAGQTYVNVHTVAHPGGEVRGQIE